MGIEFCQADPDVVEGDAEPFPDMPKEGTEPDFEKAGEKKMAAGEAKSAGDWEKALGLYTEVWRTFLCGLFWSLRLVHCIIAGFAFGPKCPYPCKPHVRSIVRALGPGA